MKVISKEQAALVSGAGDFVYTPSSWTPPMFAPPRSPSPDHRFDHESSIGKGLINGAIGGFSSMVGESVVHKPENVGCTVAGVVAGAVVASVVKGVPGVAAGGAGRRTNNVNLQRTH